MHTTTILKVGVRVLQQTCFDAFGANQSVQDKAWVAGNGRSLGKTHNAALDALVCFRRASQKSVIHVVALLAKWTTLHCEARLVTNRFLTRCIHQSKLAGVLVSALLLASCQSDNPDTKKTENGLDFKIEQIAIQKSGGPKCSGKLSGSMEDTRCARVDLSYPNITVSDNSEKADALNKFIKALLLNYNEDELPTSAEELADMFIADYQQFSDHFGDWEMERRIEVVFRNKKFVTLNYTEYGNTGGAHPFSVQNYYVFDLEKGRQLGLNDILAPGYERALNKVGEAAFRKARELSSQKDLEEAGFWFEENTFKLNNNFGVLKKGLVFVFNPYEVAPYALGPTEFVIPWRQIRDLIPKDGPLAELRGRPRESK